MHPGPVAAYQTAYGTVRFVVPDEISIERVSQHLCPVEADDSGFDDYDMPIEVDDGPIAHRIWWLDDDSCRGGALCRCGRLSLVELMDMVDDASGRNEMLTVHLAEMVAAFNHYWAGDAAARDSSRLLEAVCADCLIYGEAHVEMVGGEANALAEELGEALAVYQFHLGVGERRLQRPPGR